ncbi:MAG: restriction endonuclease subunit S [Desulfobacterales bacterium]|nr:restriction endonuclease subunit S [Desulfobacterales bacterium]
MGEEKRKLPEGWAEATIGDVTLNKVPQTVPDKDSFFTYVDISSIDNTSKEIVSPKELHGEQAPSRARQGISVNDVLVSMTRPNLNAVALVPHSLDGAIASTGFDILRSVEVEPKWLYLHVRSGEFVEDMSALVKGALYPAIKSNDVRSYRIPIPPLNEQKRIVARIEELQAHSRRAREALETVPDLLEQLRQSILAAAFRGDLTKEWRKQHQDVEPASELLKRIRFERRKRWEAAELDKLKCKGLTGDNLDEAFAKQRKKYKEPVPVDTSDLPELPEGWCWAIVEELSLLVTKGSSPRWQGFEYTTTGVPFVRSQNVLSGSLDLAELAFLPKSFNKKERRSILAANDVLVNIVGASIGRAALATEDVAGGNVNQAVAVIRLIQEGFLPSLIVYWLLSPTGQRQIHGGKVDVARANLSLTDVSAIIVPLPPFVEQEELVFQLCENMKLLARLSDKIVEIQTSLDDLDYSALTKAFRGQLAPQDPKDEPASVLLERIREEKEQEAANQKPRDKRRGRKMTKRKDKQKEVLVVLREASRAMTPEEVFAAGGFEEDSVDAFYEQLRRAVVSKQVREMREGDLIQLEATGK